MTNRWFRKCSFITLHVYILTNHIFVRKTTTGMKRSLYNWIKKNEYVKQTTHHLSTCFPYSLYIILLFFILLKHTKLTKNSNNPFESDNSRENWIQTLDIDVNNGHFFYPKIKLNFYEMKTVTNKLNKEDLF